MSVEATPLIKFVNSSAASPGEGEGKFPRPLFGPATIGRRGHGGQAFRAWVAGSMGGGKQRWRGLGLLKLKHGE